MYISNLIFCYLLISIEKAISFHKIRNMKSVSFISSVKKMYISLPTNNKYNNRLFTIRLISLKNKDKSGRLKNVNFATKLDDFDISDQINKNTTSITKNFITNIIDEDLSNDINGGRVVTRFPPEPNGYLHLGHAKSINFNFGVAKAYNGVTNMRMDDTNPAKEDIEYVKSILDDVRWLVTGEVSTKEDPWEGSIRHASDYFETMYEAAEYLIMNDLAYIENLSQDEMKQYKGTLTEPGKDSPYKTRSIEENLKFFRSMKNGEFPDGYCVLRAKIDMTSPNMNMRDPTLYRIKRAPHPMTGDKWCIYPMYDFAHAISDALEGITHSLCTLEFVDHRPLYDWTIDKLMPSGLLPFKEKNWRPRQYEFSRLNLQYTVLSKRKLIQLVSEKHVEGWDDPRMPTICGLRRRGYPSSAIRLFCERVGISKAENNIDISVLEDCAREVLDQDAPRAFALMDPLKVTVTNWKEGDVEVFSVEKHPKVVELGNRDIPFSGSILIDREDFFDTGVDGSLQPPKGYKRLLIGEQVRLKYAYVITCNSVVRDENNNVIELLCTYDPLTRSGVTPEGSKRAKGIIQWVSADHAVKAELALYDRLFVSPSPGKDSEDGDFMKDINKDSYKLCSTAVVESSLVDSKLGTTFQFERLGYFCLDMFNNKQPLSSSDVLKFNRVATLKDTWSFNLNQVTEESTKAKATKANNNNNNNNNSDDKSQETIEDIRRVEMRVGIVLSAERHPDADSLYVEKVDCGDETGPRTIISGLVKYVSVEDLVGRKVVVVCNLKPSKMRGIVSEGMLLAASRIDESTGNELVELLSPPNDCQIGELIRVDGYAEPKPDVQLKSKNALEVWKRVAAKLITDSEKIATYGSPENRLITNSGPCYVASLTNSLIR